VAKWPEEGSGRDVVEKGEEEEAGRDVVERGEKDEGGEEEEKREEGEEEGGGKTGEETSTQESLARMTSDLLSCAPGQGQSTTAQPAQAALEQKEQAEKTTPPHTLAWAGHVKRPGMQIVQPATGGSKGTSHRGGEKKAGSPRPPGALGSHSQLGLVR